MGAKKDTPEGSELRQRAEKQLEIDLDSTEAFSEMSPEKMADLIHELQVHQIELKMQNDELRSIQDDLEKTRGRYSHLYDFAPIGYFTLNLKGFIHEANLTFATMLGIERGVLIGQPFSLFVLRDDQDTFYKHRQQLLEKESPRSFELSLVRNDGHVFYARLECTVITSKENDLKQIRAAVSDITERKQAEWALEASYSLMKIGESIAQLGFFERNWQTGEGQWSEGFYRLLGLTNQQARTHEEFTKFIHEYDRQRVIETYSRDSANQDEYGYRISIGSDKWEYCEHPWNGRQFIRQGRQAPAHSWNLSGYIGA